MLRFLKITTLIVWSFVTCFNRKDTCSSFSRSKERTKRQRNRFLCKLWDQLLSHMWLGRGAITWNINIHQLEIRPHSQDIEKISAERNFLPNLSKSGKNLMLVSKSKKFFRIKISPIISAWGWACWWHWMREKYVQISRLKEKMKDIEKEDKKNLR